MTAATTQFIRHTPTASLRAYFQQKSYSLVGYDWDANPQDPITPLLRVVDTMTPEERERLSIDAERIHEMTDELGQSALLSINSGDPDYLGLVTAYDRALYVFLRSPEMFRVAEEIRYADEHRAGRSWDGFRVEPLLNLHNDPISLESFKEKVKDIFGDSGELFVEVFQRLRMGEEEDASPLTQVMVYREKLPDSVLTFENKALVTKVFRPVGVFALTYNAASGEVEVVADGRENRAELAKAFTTALLHSSVDVEILPRKRYNLMSLLKNCDFPHDYEDNIESVKVALIRLQSYEKSKKVTLEVGSRGQDTIYQFAEDSFGSNNPLHGGFIPTQAKIVIKFRPDAPGRVGKTLPIKITMPNGCDLKSRTEHEKAVGEKCLHRWGLIEEVKDVEDSKA